MTKWQFEHQTTDETHQHSSWSHVDEWTWRNSCASKCWCFMSFDNSHVDFISSSSIPYTSLQTVAPCMLKSGVASTSTLALPGPSLTTTTGPCFTGTADTFWESNHIHFLYWKKNINAFFDMMVSQSNHTNSYGLVFLILGHSLTHSLTHSTSGFIRCAEHVLSKIVFWVVTSQAFAPSVQVCLRLGPHFWNHEPPLPQQVRPSLPDAHLGHAN